MAPCMGPESRSCTFPLGRSVSRKAGKQIGKLNIYIYCCIELFSSDISVIKFQCAVIAVSSSPAVCGFSSFWLTVFG